MDGYDAPREFRRLPTKDEQDQLRIVLKRIESYTSRKRILQMATDICGTAPFTPRALGDFIEKGATLRPENFWFLADALLYSSIGRSLSAINLKENRLPHNRLIYELEQGYKGSAKRSSVVGVWAMYHGSYLHDGHFVIRALEITSGNEGPISVLDTIKEDETSGTPDLKTANGLLTFEGDKPQIVLTGTENKLGVSLVIATEVGIDSDGRNWMIGSFLVMTKRGVAAHRRFLLVREPSETKAAMIEETGIFTRQEVAKLKEKHRKRFERLKKVMQAERLSRDPMDDF